MKESPVLTRPTAAALAAGLALSLAAPAAMSAIVINSVTGQWTSVTGGSNLTGVNTNEIRWGGSTGDKSGYRFVGVAPPPVGVSPNNSFDLGSFTHFNFPIPAGTSITGATLKVDFALDVDGLPVSLSSVFDFAHWETDNDPRPSACADGGAYGAGVNVNGCADRVTFTTNPSLTESFQYQGFDYVVNISGFLLNDQVAQQFWTTERATNTAVLRGEVIKREDLPPVPIPAAVWLLGSGLAGLAGIGWRRKANPG